MGINHHQEGMHAKVKVLKRSPQTFLAGMHAQLRPIGGRSEPDFSLYNDKECESQLLLVHAHGPDRALGLCTNPRSKESKPASKEKVVFLTRGGRPVGEYALCNAASPVGLAAPAVAMPGLGLLVATTAVAVLAFSAVLDRARAAYAWFDALVAPEDERTVSVDDVLRTVCGVLALWLVPFSSICWHLLKWLAPTGRLMLYELVQIVLFGLWLVPLSLCCLSEFLMLGWMAMRRLPAWPPSRRASKVRRRPAFSHAK